MLASGCIGTISIGNGITFDGCQPIDTAWGNRQGAIESFNTQGIRVPYLVMTGDPYFGMRFSAVRGLALGDDGMVSEAEEMMRSLSADLAAEEAALAANAGDEDFVSRDDDAEVAAAPQDPENLETSALPIIPRP